MNAGPTRFREGDTPMESLPPTNAIRSKNFAFLDFGCIHLELDPLKGLVPAAFAIALGGEFKPTALVTTIVVKTDRRYVEMFSKTLCNLLMAAQEELILKFAEAENALTAGVVDTLEVVTSKWVPVKEPVDATSLSKILDAALSLVDFEAELSSENTEERETICREYKVIAETRDLPKFCKALSFTNVKEILRSASFGVETSNHAE